MSLIITCNVFHNTVFSAARISVMPGGKDRVPYEVILADTVDGFDETITSYTVKSAGFYFTHMSAGVPAYQMLDYTLNNASSTPNILLTHTSFDGEIVTSKEDIQYIPANTTLYISSRYSIYSDSMKQTSWSGFKIDDVINTKVIFRVARTTSYTTVGSYMEFDKLIINVGQAWDACNNQLIIPMSGIYFLAFSSASVKNTRHDLHLNVNGALIARTFIYANVFNGTDVSSNSVLLKLSEGDIVKLYLLNEGPVYSDSNYQTSFAGFLFELSADQTVAWTLTFPYGVQTYLYGPTNVNFTEILLNDGSPWHSDIGRVRVPVSGLYYLKLSGISWPADYKFNLILSVNDQILMNVMEKIDTIKIGCNMRSRSLITHLSEGDHLLVSIPAGYNAYSIYNDVIFAGFLINADIGQSNLFQTPFAGRM